MGRVQGVDVTPSSLHVVGVMLAFRATNAFPLERFLPLGSGSRTPGGSDGSRRRPGTVGRPASTTYRPFGTASGRHGQSVHLGLRVVGGPAISPQTTAEDVDTCLGVFEEYIDELLG